MKISLRRIFSYQYLYVFIEILFVSNKYMYMDFLKHRSLAYYMHPKFCWFQLKCILKLLPISIKLNIIKPLWFHLCFGGFLLIIIWFCNYYFAYLYCNSFVNYINVSISISIRLIWMMMYLIHSSPHIHSFQV